MITNKTSFELKEEIKVAHMNNINYLETNC